MKKNIVLLIGILMSVGMSYSAVTLSSDFTDVGNQRDPLYNFWKVRNEIPAYPNVGSQQPQQYHDMNCIRLLGGWASGGVSNVAEDVVTWNAGLQDYVYDWDIMTDRIDGVLSKGYGIHQLVLDNPPWCFQRGLTFSANPGPGEYDEAHRITTYGNSLPPGEPAAWHDFITAMMTELVDVYGQSQVDEWRFRVHTEGDYYPHHWAGTKQDYFDHYSNTAHAVRSVLPNAKLAAHFLGASGNGRYGTEFVTWCSQNNVPYDFIGVSYYPFYTNSNQVDVDRQYNLNLKPFVDAPGWNPNAKLEIPEYTIFTEKDDDGYNMGVGTSHNPAFVTMMAKMLYENSIQRVHNWGDHYEDPVFIALEGMLGKDRFEGQKSGSPLDADNEINGIFSADAALTNIDAMIFNYNSDPTYIADETVNLSFTVPFSTGATYEYRIAVCDQANNPHYQFVQDNPLAGLWESEGGWVLDRIKPDSVNQTDKNGLLDQILIEPGKTLWKNNQSSYPGYNSLVWSGWNNISTTNGSGPGDSKLELTVPLSSFSFQKIEFRRIDVPFLPEHWQSQDIGAVGATGNASFTSGVYTVNASGADIWNAADEFRYVYRPVQGDCEVIARVSSLENTNPWAKAGVMIRETLDADAVNVAALVTPGNGVTVQKRITIGGLTSSEKVTGLVAPYWVKLTRVGDTFTGYRSVDGITWTAYTSVTIPMATNAYIGLAATSHVDGTIGTSVFDNVDTTFAPTAWAGADQWIVDTNADGIESFALDGSSSVVSDGESIVEYLWSRGSMPLASGVTPVVELPLGTHLLTLQVMDSNGAIGKDQVAITVELAGNGSTGILAGWDTWNSATAPSASVRAENVTGTALTTTEQQAWNTTDERGASADGDWGTFAGPPVASTGVVDGENLTLNNAATGGTITFSVSNNGASDLALSAFHFDAYAFRPKAPRAYELSVLAGSDITVGTIYTSADDEITSVGGANANLAHDDIDHSLLDLADHILGAGETVDFLLAFSSGEGDGSGGHHLFVDNVAISFDSGEAYPDNDGNGLPDWWENFYLGSTGQVAGVDSDFDGLTNGDELIAGTNPGDINSAFVMHEFEEATGGGYTVKWNSYSDRTYNVLKCSSLTSNDWNSISGPLPGTGGEMSFTAPESPSNTFYRIQVTQP